MKDRQQDRSQQHQRNHPQGDAHRHIPDIAQQHLQPHKGQDQRHPVVQVMEDLHDAGQRKIKRPQAQDGKNVGTEHNKWIGGDAQDRRNGIQRKQDVGGFHDQQHHQQRGDQPGALAANDELISPEGADHRKKPLLLQQAQHHILIGMHIFLIMKHHADAGVDQESAEDVDDPVKAVDQGHPHRDHEPAHEQRAQDPPEQNFMLVFGMHAEIGKDHDKNKDIVDAEGFFDQVAGQEHQGRLRAQVEVEPEVESQRYADPYPTPDQRLAHFDNVGFAVKHPEVQCQHDADDHTECHPGPNRFRHSANSLRIDLKSAVSST